MHGSMEAAASTLRLSANGCKRRPRRRAPLGQARQASHQGPSHHLPLSEAATLPATILPGIRGVRRRGRESWHCRERERERCLVQAHCSGAWASSRRELAVKAGLRRRGFCFSVARRSHAREGRKGCRGREAHPTRRRRWTLQRALPAVFVQFKFVQAYRKPICVQDEAVLRRGQLTGNHCCRW